MVRVNSQNPHRDVPRSRISKWYPNPGPICGSRFVSRYEKCPHCLLKNPELLRAVGIVAGESIQRVSSVEWRLLIQGCRKRVPFCWVLDSVNVNLNNRPANERTGAGFLRER